MQSSLYASSIKHQAAVFKGAIYLTGGFGDGAGENNLARTYYNDVWSSTDGKTWTELTPSANFEARSSHQMVVLNDMLYLIGGRDDANIYNDIWRSNDGINWRKLIRGKFILKIVIQRKIVFAVKATEAVR